MATDVHVREIDSVVSRFYLTFQAARLSCSGPDEEKKEVPSHINLGGGNGSNIYSRKATTVHGVADTEKKCRPHSLAKRSKRGRDVNYGGPCWKRGV